MHSSNPHLFLAAETRLEGMGEKWHRFCVLLSAPLETFGFCTLEVTLDCCQICVMAEDIMDGCKEVSHQSSSDSSFHSPSSSSTLH